MPKPLLIEIGTEEIPASYIKPALDQLAKGLLGTLKEERLLSVDPEVHCFATPRRLTVALSAVDTKQKAHTEEVFGPSLKAARDAEGQWTKAALGFAKKNGLEPEQLTTQSDPKGVEKLFAQITLPAESTETVLARVLPKIVAALKFPKAMRFLAGSGFRFARPLRWLLVLLDKSVVDLEVEGIKANRYSLGHRFLNKNPKVKVKSASVEDYKKALASKHVIVDFEQRKVEVVNLIKAKVTELCEDPDWDQILDDHLIETVNFFVESPQALLGSFDPSFLEVPSQVPITSMKYHQRNFPIISKSKGLLPNFVAITNGGQQPDLIRKGVEKVLAARLSDAIFFWKEDTKQNLADKYEQLKDVLYQKEIGSYYDKTESTRTLAKQVARRLGFQGEELGLLDRAVMLSKVDLITNMVYEFPELQGVMGGEYALYFQENEAVAAAIANQYEMTAQDCDLSNLLILADRLDTLISAFRIGTKVTGSSDPYGLRRMAATVINIVDERKFNLNLSALWTDLDKETQGTVQDFFIERLRSYCADKLNIRYDCLEAVLAGTGDDFDLADLINKAKALNELAGHSQEGFDDVMILFGRVGNILKQAQDKGEVIPELSDSLLAEKAEQNLSKQLTEVGPNYLAAIEKRNYGQSLRALMSLREPIDSFFDDVMVMDENPRVRGNRLALLSKVATMFLLIGDFSKVVNAQS